MRWERKATIARACARLPFGERLYKFGQKRMGDLRAQPAVRLTAQAEMIRWLNRYKMPALNKSFLEVGTGHIPVVPIGFYLAGAAETITVDVHRRIDWDLTRASLEWIASHRADLATLYAGASIDKSVFDERLAKLTESKNDPKGFLERAGIRYLAPMDAADTRLPAASLDCHYSMTVLEHISEEILKAILSEAKRILKPGGVALHFIDPSDHFEHQDRSITPINFLKYSDEDWQRLAGNEFTYCNRLRASDFLRFASDAGFSVLHCETTIDEPSKSAIRSGFPVNQKFAHYAQDDLCTRTLRVMWQ
jgi:SAM-dependent methyltransferase